MKLRNELQIGIVGLIALITLFFGIKFLKGSEMFSSNRIYYSVYNDVTDMHEGNYIYINGMKVGYIKSIKPMNQMNNRFVVEISIDKNIKVPKDSQLTLFDAGLLTGKAMKIELGQSLQYLTKKDTLVGKVELGMTDALTGNISTIMQRIDTLTASLNNTLNTKTQENIHHTMENINLLSFRLNTLVQNADNVIVSQRNKLNDILSNVEDITNNLKNNSNNINAILTNFNDISDTIAKANIGQTLAQVNSSLENLSQILDRIDNGNGNIGQLINDDNLYQNINSAANNLNLLIADIKANPKKYVKVSVF